MGQGDSRSPAALTASDATAADIPGILDLLECVFQPFASEFRPNALRETEETIARNLGRWMVMRERGHVTSCVTHWPEEDCYRFRFLATRPEARERGLGSALVEAVIARAEDSGHREVRIILRRTLSRNISFFTRRGFRYMAPYRSGQHDIYHMWPGGR
ncbi:GNAT family N-acetyltransferase [Streptomyces sp. S186]|uniref:GNAT family N-acetyltransferase n=1 Tax=Streptomyces sp. S186 TaxID=3434395 RepID=UPI003F671C03